MKKKVFSLLLAMVMSVTLMLGNGVSAWALSDIKTTTIEIYMPALNETMEIQATKDSFTVSGGVNILYSVSHNLVDVYESGNRINTFPTYFERGKTYTFVVKLDPASGYEIVDGVGNYTGTVNIPAGYNKVAQEIVLEAGVKGLDVTVSYTIPGGNSDDSTEQRYYLNDLYDELASAAAMGGKQTVEWNEGDSLPYEAMKYLQDHPDLTLVFNYTYENEKYSVTIPGKNVKADESIPWYGPLWLWGHFGTASATTGSEYTITAGDTLSTIAAKLGKSVKDLADKNGIADVNKIFVGKKILY